MNNTHYCESCNKGFIFDEPIIRPYCPICGSNTFITKLFTDKPDKTHVNFDIVHEEMKRLDLLDENQLSDIELNIKNFFKLMERSSTFAHKAHKELKRRS